MNPPRQRNHPTSGEPVDLLTALAASLQRARDAKVADDAKGDEQQATVQVDELHTFPDVVQRTDEWYALRCGLITASEVGSLITSKTFAVASNDTSRGLASRAAAERITGHVDPTGMSYDMARGMDDEPFAVAAYSEHHAPVTECGFMTRSWGYSTLGYSPDGLVGDNGLIEIKSRRGKKHIDTVLSGRVPTEDIAQCQAGLFVSGRAWLDYVSFCGGMALWTVRVFPDPQWFTAIRAAVDAFEDAVDATVATYQEAVKGLPMTTRPPMDMVI